MSLDNPQLEDGFTPVANPIMEALARTQLSGYEWRVLLFLLRKTYGWSKKSDLIPLSQFVDGTGIRKKHIINAITRLVQKRIIYKSGTEIRTRKAGTYEFNKHFGEWQLVPKYVPAHNLVPKSVPNLVPKKGPSTSIKDSTSKDLKRFVVGNKIDDDPVVSLYSKICVPKGFPSIKTLTTNRQRAIKRATNDYGLERLEALFAKAVTSSFLLGRLASLSHPGWRADFDFLLKPDTLVHIDEGSRYFDALSGQSEPAVPIPIWTEAQDLKNKERGRKWLDDDKAKEEAR